MKVCNTMHKLTCTNLYYVLSFDVVVFFLSPVEIGLEQQIVLSCQALQLLPTQLFQTAVAQVI